MALHLKKNREITLSALSPFGDPFEKFPRDLFAKDIQGWSSSVHHFLDGSIEQIKPSVIVEIGVWKGRSTIHMGKKIKELGLDSVIVCVDTWLGSAEHWSNVKYANDLRVIYGYPNLYMTFLKNIIDEELQDVVIPVPLDSINASNLFKIKGLKADLIHIDAGHDFRSVTNDLEEWWPSLRTGGVIVGDDYSEDKWPGVYKAWNTFFGGIGAVIEEGENKVRVIKV
ncbi:MAG: class I SAM-dependent methyltransferase [Pseudomonadota bacterium]